MTRDERDRLHAERSTLQSTIVSTPKQDVLDRASLEARLREVENRLVNGLHDRQLPPAARLTFRGRPVIGTHGIFAEFGLTATRAFTDVVVTMAASLDGPLGLTGPVPNRDRNQLLITNTAIGSFGFELQEHTDDPLSAKETNIAQALSITQKLLESTIGSDDEMTETTAGIDPRVLKAARDFLETLVINDAVCGLAVGAHFFGFMDVGQVRSAFQRLAQDNRHEDEETFTGFFQGVLPGRRTFEFLLEDNGLVILGKIGPGITDPIALNQHLLRPVAIKLTATRVGSGRPKYVLNVPPFWPANP